MIYESWSVVILMEKSIPCGPTVLHSEAFQYDLRSAVESVISGEKIDLAAAN
jgi:hypothetical protein